MFGRNELCKVQWFHSNWSFQSTKCNVDKSAHTGYGISPWTDAAEELISKGNTVSVLHINAFLLNVTFLCYTNIFILKFITYKKCARGPCQTRQNQETVNFPAYNLESRIPSLLELRSFDYFDPIKNANVHYALYFTAGNSSSKWLLDYCTCDL